VVTVHIYGNSTHYGVKHLSTGKWLTLWQIIK